MEDTRNNAKIAAAEAENPEDITLRILDILKKQPPSLRKKKPMLSEDGMGDETGEGAPRAIKPQLGNPVNPNMFQPPKP